MALDSASIPGGVKLFCASMAGVAGTLACYPLDLLKLNLQVAGEGTHKKEHSTSFHLAQTIVKRDGIKGLYTGLTASILRQALYTGGRLGTFQILVDYFTVDGVAPGLLIKSACGIVGGIFGGIVGLPPDVALTRMAVDKRLAPEKRRNYTHVFNAMGRMVKEEGAPVLFRGLQATVVRAVVVNLSQLLSYVQAKQLLIGYNLMSDNSACHFTASTIAAFVATCCTLPPDIAKTRMQNMKILAGKPEYRNMIDVWFKIVTREGPFALWKGFTPLLLRNGPQSVVLFVVYEKLMQYYRYLYSNK